jgi:hypothetical protein
MIGKVTIGSSFGGVVRYVTQKPEARLIHAEGVRMENFQTAIDDFNMQRKLNPDLRRAVGHISLSWSKNDAEKLTSEIIMQRAKEYMQKMKIDDTQYLLVEHRDKNHPHVHLIYNRVSNQGKTISDRFQKERNQKICKEMTLKYGYYLGKDKSQVNRLQLTGADKIKYEFYDTVTAASAAAQNWHQLEIALRAQGISLVFKYKSGTREVQGISFGKGDVKMKGSKIDRSLSYGKLNEKIQQNQKGLIVEQTPLQLVQKSVSPMKILDRPATSRTDDFEKNLLKELLSPVESHSQTDPYELRRRKKRRKKSKGQSL